MLKRSILLIVTLIMVQISYSLEVEKETDKRNKYYLNVLPKDTWGEILSFFNYNELKNFKLVSNEANALGIELRPDILVDEMYNLNKTIKEVAFQQLEKKTDTQKILSFFRSIFSKNNPFKDFPSIPQILHNIMLHNKVLLLKHPLNDETIEQLSQKKIDFHQKQMISKKCPFLKPENFDIIKGIFPLAITSRIIDTFNFLSTLQLCHPHLSRFTVSDEYLEDFEKLPEPVQEAVGPFSLNDVHLAIIQFMYPKVTALSLRLTLPISFESLKNLKKLQRIDLFSMDFCSVDSLRSFKILAPQLISLTFFDIRMDQINFNKLTPFLTALQTFKIVRLNCCDFKALSKLKKLKKLFLSVNEIKSFSFLTQKKLKVLELPFLITRKHFIKDFEVFSPVDEMDLSVLTREIQMRFPGIQSIKFNDLAF